MLELLQVNNINEIDVLRTAYHKELPYAQDLNIEENIWESKYYMINRDSKQIGYACIDSSETLWEYYLEDNSRIYSQEIFRFLLDSNYIVAAECKTYDYLLLSLCFDFHKKSEGSAYLFRDYMEVSVPAGQYGHITYRFA